MPVVSLETKSTNQIIKKIKLNIHIITQLIVT